MATIVGTLVAFLYKETTHFDWVDQKTGVVKPIRNFRGLFEPGDGERYHIDIGFPRDADYQPPKLEVGKTYLMPVLVGINKKRQEVSYTIRTDMPPQPAPDFG